MGMEEGMTLTGGRKTPRREEREHLRAMTPRTRRTPRERKNRARWQRSVWMWERSVDHSSAACWATWLVMRPGSDLVGASSMGGGGSTGWAAYLAFVRRGRM